MTDPAGMLYVMNNGTRATYEFDLNPAARSKFDFGMHKLYAESDLAALRASNAALVAALEQFAACSLVRDIVAGDTEIALAVFAARAALAASKGVQS